MNIEDKVHCPWCEEEQCDEGGGAADFVIPGRVGEASRASYECEHCYEEFEVVATSETTVEVEFP